MSLDPLYRSENLRPAFQLRYSWTGWLKSAWPNMPDAGVLDTVDPLWEQDGMRRLEQFWADDHLQATFSAKPEVSPVLLAARAKGRLQYSQNNLAFVMGQIPIWQEGFYAGTFSEYDMGAIRRSAALAGTT